MGEREGKQRTALRLERVEEELLESLWVLRESGLNTEERLVAYSNVANPQEVIGRLVERGLVVRADGKVAFSPAGEQAAADITRRHRLAERLLTDVLAFADDRLLEAGACGLEHALSPAVTDSICTLLGHPPLCPHGRAIPRGRCCRAPARAVPPVVTRLSDLKPGERGRVTVMAPAGAERLRQLETLGLVPGVVVVVRQLRPACVVEVGHTAIALDPSLAEQIFVRRGG